MSDSDRTIFFVYAHHKADTGEIFYIGKGSKKESDVYYHRAYNKSLRNRIWKFIEAKHGRTIEIVAEFDTEEESLAHEQFLIAGLNACGARLANIASGGASGCLGYKHTPEARAAMTAARRGKALSPEHAEKIRLGVRSSEARENKRQAQLRRYSNPEERAKQSAIAKRILSDPELRAKLSKAISEGRARNGYLTKVRCVENGQEFDSIKLAEAWLSQQGKRGSVQRCVNGYGHTAGGYHWVKVNKA